MTDAITELRAMSPRARRAILRALMPAERETVIGLLATEAQPALSNSPASLGLSAWLADRVEAAQNGQSGDSSATDAVRDYLALSLRSASSPARTPGRSLLEAVGGLGITRRRLS